MYLVVIIVSPRKLLQKTDTEYICRDNKSILVIYKVNLEVININNDR